jgi:hypothetical protein
MCGVTSPGRPPGSKAEEGCTCCSPAWVASTPLPIVGSAPALHHPPTDEIVTARNLRTRLSFGNSSCHTWFAALMIVLRKHHGGAASCTTYVSAVQPNVWRSESKSSQCCPTGADLPVTRLVISRGLHLEGKTMSGWPGDTPRQTSHKFLVDVNCEASS